ALKSPTATSAARLWKCLTINPTLWPMKRAFTVTGLFLLLGCCLYGAPQRDSVLRRLDAVLSSRKSYDDKQETKIASLRAQVANRLLLPQEQYRINLQLIETYRKYKLDSAVVYAQKNRQLAQKLGDRRYQSKADIELAGLYSSMGMYVESLNVLENINRAALPPDLLPEYFERYMLFCSHYGQSNNKTSYYQQSEQYRDSLLAVLNPGSLQYQITLATRALYQGQGDSLERQLQHLLKKTTDAQPERAIVAYLLGVLYKNQGNQALQEQYFAISAIADIVNAIKDNASLQALALTYYDMGNIERAYLFMETAINDAIFCNVRYRTVEASTYYPIINASFRTLEQEQKTELRQYLMLISVLSLDLIIGIAYSYIQVKRLAKTRKALFETNQQLSQLNHALQEANQNLFEANHIKEEYIAHFFDICSANIEKLENYRKSLHKKAVNNQYDLLLKELKSTDLAENELAELYYNFDTIFLNLYPTFVSEFNSLLLPDEAIHPKPGEQLNTELRIFALLRLGITDSVKIAGFLRYSLQTVYNYRTKIRHKTAMSREEFEAKIEQIGTLRQIS